METEPPETKKQEHKYLKKRMQAIGRRSSQVFLISWVFLVLFVALYSNNWLEMIWRGLLIILTRGRSDPAA
ncbi:hypothetical protein BSY240_848 [Agrobacterium sp. RAC06]|nr:hypothetical protein BSY240_848 [Agrobacterium sp. RAC06]